MPHLCRHIDPFLVLKKIVNISTKNVDKSKQENLRFVPESRSPGLQTHQHIGPISYLAALFLFAPPLHWTHRQKDLHSLLRPRNETCQKAGLHGG
jgi:hypothetical protein